MLAMLVTDAVLKSGTDVKEKQFVNMLAMVVTDAVLKSGTDVKE
jgi:hypothetical protein